MKHEKKKNEIVSKQHDELLKEYASLNKVSLFSFLSLFIYP